MKAISLCSGADGFSYAASLLDIEVTAHVELDPVFDDHYKRHWPNAKRFYDLKTTDPKDLGSADIIYGGEPCQGNSVAGQRKGKEDDRYLWPDYLRICKVVRPPWIINENVTGSISNLVLDTKIADLENAGYSCQAYNIPACAIGAFNERKRIWLVAHSNSINGFRSRSSNQNSQLIERSQKTILPQSQQRSRVSREWTPVRGVSGRVFPSPERSLFEMVNDVSQELAEIKAYGNAVNPWIPYVLLSFILNIEGNR